MLDDALRLTIDTVFPPKQTQPSPFRVAGCDDSSNMWGPVVYKLRL